MKNKKLFAILTLVCFMMTLMPVAAFAAATDFSAPASVFATVDKNAEVQKNEKVDVQLSMKNVANGLCTTQQTVYVWAETVANQPNDAFEALKADGTAYNGSKGVYAVPVTQAITEFKATFYRAGEYTLKASVENPLTASKVSDVVLFNGAAADYKKVIVNNTAQETEYWGVKVESGTYSDFLNDGDETDKNIVVEANGVKSTEITLTVYNGTESSPATAASAIVTGYPVALDTNSSNIEISDTSLTTNHNGQIKFKVAGLREGVYKVYVTVGDFEATVLVQVGASIANAIEVIKASRRSGCKR